MKEEKKKKGRTFCRLHQQDKRNGRGGDYDNFQEGSEDYVWGPLFNRADTQHPQRRRERGVVHGNFTAARKKKKTGYGQKRNWKGDQLRSGNSCL